MLTYLQLMVMVLMISKPIFPLVEYAVFKKNIAANLCEKKNVPNNCCKGKCYLEKQLAKSTDTDNKENRRSSKTNKHDIKDFIVHFTPEVFLNVSQMLYACYALPINENLLTGSIFNPPEV